MNILNLFKRSMIINSLLSAFVIILLFLPVSHAGEYLSASDIGIVAGGTLGVKVLSELVFTFDSSKTPLIKGPLPLERSIQNLLGGECRADKTNFLDSKVGSAATPLGMNILLQTCNTFWPQEDRAKTILQDQYLYSTGLFATKNITFIFKRMVGRQRPLPYLNPDEASKRKEIDLKYDRESFFSGHTSSSFFSATFVNKRLRSIMRSKLLRSDYDSWSWAPPTLLYGWASFVGWSRIHACKHYISDVLVGALAGYLIAELFYSFGDDFYKQQDNINGDELNTTANSSKMIFQIEFKF